MALRFASAAAAGLPASVSMSARMAQVFHGSDAWPNCALHSIARRISCRASSRRRSLRRVTGEIVPRRAFVRHIADLDILVRRLPVKGRRFLRAVEDIVIQVPQLPQRARLPGDISEPHLDRERFPVGILRRFRLSRLLIHHAGLMPDHGDGARFVQLREPLARFFISRQRLRVAALLHADGPKLAFSDGDLPVVTELLGAADTLFVGRRRFVEPAQVEKTVASFREADGRHPLRALTGRSCAMASKRCCASSNSGKACSDPPAVFNTRARRKQAIARS